MYRIGYLGCSHLGYRQRSMNRQHPTGINLREMDGYIAHEAIMRDMIDHKVNGIVDGGDLFHVDHPSVRSVDTALRIDDLRVNATAPNGQPVWRITNGGNHDNGASSHIAAVSHIHRAKLNSLAVFPSEDKPGEQRIGPWPGFYEIHQPDPTVNIYIHIVSHNGLDPALADKGITIDPQPIAGAINIFSAHGIFSADGRLFGAEDRHGATRVIPEEWAHRGWDQMILSDYHTMGPIPGFKPKAGSKHQEVWMTGSALRRGFSDECCARGWLEIEVDDDGKVSVTPHSMWQRPQVDFPIIDARTMTSEDIDALVTKRLAQQPMWDTTAEERTGDGGYILRQVIAHTSPHQRRTLSQYRRQWAQAASSAAYWSADYVKPLTSDTSEPGDDENMGKETVVSDRPRKLNLAEEFAKRQNYGRVAAVLNHINDDDPEVKNDVVQQVSESLAGLSSVD